MLRLTIIESPPDEALDVDSWVVGPNGATLGRVKENTWTLPDRQSLLSRTHCEVLCEQGTYVLLDTSTNGTFLDGSNERIGRGQKATLKDGSRIHLGGYIILVGLETANGNSTPKLGDRPDFLAPPQKNAEIERESALFPESLSDPLATGSSITDSHAFEDIEAIPLSNDPFGFTPNHSDLPLAWTPSVSREGLPVQSPAQSPASHPDSSFIRQQGRASNRPADVGLQPPHSSNAGDIPDDWYIEQDAIDSTPTPEAAPVPAAPPRPAVKKVSLEDSTGQKQPSIEPPDVKDGARLDLDASLRQALSLVLGDTADSLSTRNLIQVVKELAFIVAESTPVMMQALASRSQFKDSLRLSQTMVRGRDNNPLKPDINLSPREALQHMLLNDHPGLLQGRLAMEEGFRELAAHQTALIAALRPAILETLARLSPLRIQEVVGTEVTPGFSLLRGKGKLWDAYLVIYAKMAESGRGNVEQAFMQSLAAHYEDSLREND